MHANSNMNVIKSFDAKQLCLLHISWIRTHYKWKLQKRKTTIFLYPKTRRIIKQNIVPKPSITKTKPFAWLFWFEFCFVNVSPSSVSIYFSLNSFFVWITYDYYYGWVQKNCLISSSMTPGFDHSGAFSNCIKKGSHKTGERTVTSRRTLKKRRENPESFKLLNLKLSIWQTN